MMKRVAMLALLTLAGCENGQRFDLVCDVTTYQTLQAGNLPVRQDTGKLNERFSVDLKGNRYCLQSEPGVACSEDMFGPITEASTATLKLGRFTTIDRTSGAVTTDWGGVGSSGTCARAAFTRPKQTKF